MKGFLLLAALAALIYLTAAQPEATKKQQQNPSVSNQIGTTLKKSVKDRLKFAEEVGKAIRTAKMKCAGNKCNVCVNVEKNLKVCAAFILNVEKVEMKTIFRINGKVISKRIFSASENYPFCVHMPDLESFSMCLRSYEVKFKKNDFKMCTQIDISSPDMKWASLGLNCMKFVKKNLQLVAPLKKISMERGVFHYQIPIKK